MIRLSNVFVSAKFNYEIFCAVYNKLQFILNIAERNREKKYKINARKQK